MCCVLSLRQVSGRLVGTWWRNPQAKSHAACVQSSDFANGDNLSHTEREKITGSNREEVQFLNIGLLPVAKIGNRPILCAVHFPPIAAVDASSSRMRNHSSTGRNRIMNICMLVEMQLHMRGKRILSEGASYSTWFKCVHFEVSSLLGVIE